MIDWDNVKVEAEKIPFCPKCGCGDSDSDFILMCKTCLKEIKEGEEIVCYESQKGCCTPVHYHKKCFEKMKVKK